MENDIFSCPFCGVKEYKEYDIMLHVETYHSDGDSPFIVNDATSAASDDDDAHYAQCPVEGCGEALLLTELDSHIDMHATIDQAETNSTNDLWETKDTKSRGEFPKSKSQNSGSGNATKSKREPAAQQNSVSSWKLLLKKGNHQAKSEAGSSGKTPRRKLGKAELGPYANEKQMPSRLVKLLASDGETKAMNTIDSTGRLKRTQVCANQTDGIVPVLAQLLRQDSGTQYAYLCGEAVKHVSKLSGEGGFCGYRNIQMLSSHIIGARSQGSEVFKGKVPSIFDIQEYIENAWDLGINSQGRIETGGIRGTRKYIGTPDAQAMFCSLGIACDAQGIRAKPGRPAAYQQVFEAVESYFTSSCQDYDSKVRCTTLAPIYFQHLGHSMTIIGLQKTSSTTKNLLVFDPMFSDSPSIVKLVGQTFTHKTPSEALKPYVRNLKYLSRYNDFELLKLCVPKNGVMQLSDSMLSG